MSAPTARIEAHFCAQNNRTRLEHLFCAAPLKIAKPFAFQDGENEGLSILTMDASPGLLAGDNYELKWHLGEQTRVHLSTQGFTRVHPSTENLCALQTQIKLENGAHLEWFPEPLMLFANADLRQKTEVELDETATLLMGEVWCAGRVGRKIGEEFQFHRFQNRLIVRQGGQLIFASQLDLCPQKFDPRASFAWGDFTHSGTIHVFSPRVDEAWPEHLRAAIEDEIAQNPALQKAGALDFGVSLLARRGVIVSLLGRRACDLQSILSRLRAAAGMMAKEGENWRS